jgi:hypothetical protein
MARSKNFEITGSITVFTVFRLLTDFVCLYNYEFGLSLCKNKTITNPVFPDQLKQAQVVALHKKNKALDKSNYRPVSIINKGNNKITELRTILRLWTGPLVLLQCIYFCLVPVSNLL